MREECIQSAKEFGHTIFYNLCSGDMEIIVWGGMDWVLMMSGLVTRGLLIVLLGAIIYRVIST